MKSKVKDWKVIHYHFHQNIEQKNDPKLVGKKVFRFDDKHEAIKKFEVSCNTFAKKSYEQEVHSIAALKFYYHENGKALLSYVLLHHKNRQFLELEISNEELTIK